MQREDSSSSGLDINCVLPMPIDDWFTVSVSPRGWTQKLVAELEFKGAGQKNAPLNDGLSMREWRKIQKMAHQVCNP